METKEYRTVNKEKWGDGPWQKEPDKMQWEDGATKLPCLIVRNNGGALCGYVGVAAGHPLYGKGYSDIDCSIPAHGGLTFADFCAENLKNEHSMNFETHHICHVPGPGEPDKVWWLGFDCAHSGDMSPAYAAVYSGRFRFSDEVYRDVPYVQEVCKRLAAALAEMK